MSKTFLWFTVGMILGGSCTAYSNSREQIIDTITEVASEHGIDPNLALAVVEVESGFKVDAVGPKREIGLMQLHPKYFPGAQFDVETNVRFGIKHLVFWKRNCPTKEKKQFVICYNRGWVPSRNPMTNQYYLKVMRAYERRTSHHLLTAN